MEKVKKEPVLIKLRDVLTMTSMSKAYIYLLINNSEFPKPVKIGRSSFWVYSEVIGWIESKIDERVC